MNLSPVLFWVRHTAAFKIFAEGAEVNETRI